MKEYFKYLESTAIYRKDNLYFEVILKDVKKSYGDIRFLVTPVSGFGEIWVSLGNLGLCEVSSLKGFNQPIERV